MIGKKVVDRKTGDVGLIVNFGFFYLKDEGHHLVFKVEFKSDEDYLIVKRKYNEILFIKD